jgi:hypothetical protein
MTDWLDASTWILIVTLTLDGQTDKVSPFVAKTGILSERANVVDTKKHIVP